MRNDHTGSDILDLAELTKSKNNGKSHPWRVCPTGYHYVKSHSLTIPPSKDYPEGHVVTRHEHCAKNPTTPKELLSFDEICAINNKHLSAIHDRLKPCIAYPRGDIFDHLIIGWVKYWVDIYKPKDLLDPNLIKALIWSESSFKEKQVTQTHNNKHGCARGLMQLTDSTREILSDPKEELRNHYIELSEAEVLNPSANICAGIRWIFRKKITANHRLHHTATWQDAIAEYKGILGGLMKHNPKSQKKMDIILNHYHELLEGRSG